MAAPAELADHLERHYGIAVAGLEQLDTDVLRVRRRDGEDWVARIAPPERSLRDVEADAQLLRALERGNFPAERCAHAQPASELDGRAVLVTGFVEGERPPPNARTFAYLGGMLGGLHARAGEALRAGGAWHHLAPVGGPREEIAAASALLEDAAGRVGLRELAQYDRLRDEVERTDDCADLPTAFVHPDFVPINALATAERPLVIVDWSGAGRGPRLWSIGFLLWAAGARSPGLVDVVVSRYRRRTRLEPEELARLPGAIRARAVMIEAWCFGTARRGLDETLARVSEINARSESIARAAFASFRG